MKQRTFKLAEVCKELDLPPYVLRYWETEFPALQSESRGSGAQRVFNAEDLVVLRRIRQLLYEEGYTIAGAKKKLDSDPPSREDGGSGPLFSEAPAASGEPPSDTAPAALDSSADERIETLRRGVTEALKEARAILSLLEKFSS
jgi:DNA-binding transcriptional MerR regulator